jgi:hypothetical protein
MAGGYVYWYYGEIAGYSPGGVIDIAWHELRVSVSAVHHQTKMYYCQHYVIQDQQFEVAVVVQILNETSYEFRVHFILL